MGEVIDWLMFHDYARLHSTLDYVSPMMFGKMARGTAIEGRTIKWLGGTFNKGKFSAVRGEYQVLRHFTAIQSRRFAQS